MKYVITIWSIAVVTVAIFATTATAEVTAAERSFGTPEMTLVKETEMKGRKNKNDWWWGAPTIKGGQGKFDTTYTPTGKRPISC
ncbi:MAG: hypothetical protein HQ567_03825 [Candidatus Nealsonbacteria bacterium]|nr:hypothetical protein [Candidatus Nealsonbacteria bacterium]